MKLDEINGLYMKILLDFMNFFLILLSFAKYHSTLSYTVKGSAKFG